MAKLNRRDFLKLASIIPAAATLSSLTQASGTQTQSNKPNVIILLFDAMSATNLSLYGYERDTTPNFKRFAERATVYHSHNSAANFTTPGTASFLTGTYPWTHRAINLGGLIARNMVEHNLFQAFNHEYTRLGFSQNFWPNYFLTQFRPKLDVILSPSAFSTVSKVIADNLQNPIAYRAYDDFLFNNSDGPPPSLIFGLAREFFFRNQFNAQSGSRAEYPHGLPNVLNSSIYFELKNIFNGILSTLDVLKPPYLTYFHFWAPHSPYRPSASFTTMFHDKWSPIKKPIHHLGKKTSQKKLDSRRVLYDRYIANVDAEFGRLIDQLDKRGILDNSYVVVTSDHGEMFERGEYGHATRLLFDPIVHIPLMISAPKQSIRTDIYSPTNSVDVLPTLLHITGHKIPDWCEGEILPGLGGKIDIERSTFSVEAKTNSAFAPLTTISVAMRKGKYKLTHYKNYNVPDSFELYDMENDPQELTDLYPTDTIAAPLKDEMLAKLDSVNQKYKK